MTFVPRRRRLEGFTRRDAARLLVAASLMIASLTAILSVDILPTGFRGEIGDIAGRDIRAPRSIDYVSEAETEARRAEARLQVPPQYDYTADKGFTSAEQQSEAFDRDMEPVDAAFAAILTDDARRMALARALPDLSSSALSTVQALTPAQWTSLRSEMARVLQSAQRAEVRDTQLGEARASFRDRLATRFGDADRQLATEVLSPLLVGNSTYDQAATDAAKESAAAQVAPVRYSISKGEVVVEEGQRIDETLYDQLERLGLLDPQPDLAFVGGWALASTLLVGLLLGWVWRFRPELWHRANSLLLLAMVVVVATLALQVTADRSVLPYFVPVAAVGLLLAVLLDSGTALVAMAILGIIAGAVSGTVELGAYVFLGGLAGIIVVRRGERLINFIQAAVAMAVVNIAVVSAFTLIGERDVTGVIQLWGAALAAAGGAAVAAVGSFVALGNLFGITTSFQLLELSNPSQPLLRRLLLETPGTYHHSLMVGNLGERAAEAIGADPLITRAAAYYHDIGKLANPTGFIENQGGQDNPHDEMTPEQSAEVVKAHVANGIDLGYRYRLPKTIISFIPQHHGTALMSYFVARARELAAAGAAPGSPQAREAEATVDTRRFRHTGPKPQSREAAILMLADGVEASVRSLTSQDEPAIRAMVERIIRERLEDGQFDECDLTLRDLDLIREAFIAQLLGMYHRRIEYPQNKIVELESRRAASGRAG
ncbi:MAG TPA: HDIG domain-containing protein [Candidatus Limnocylindrales bacterium]|nr:HDIG domain-containing protein [Candidatus Limnocylindrales bacterium]